MRDFRMPSIALWRVVRSLEDVEMRTLWRRVAHTRLRWLLHTLRQMPTYSDEALRKAYKEAFPQADGRLLRVYKQQLWKVLLEELPLRHGENLALEVQIWQQLWLSVLLWQRGLGDIAEVLWYRSISQAVEVGWYEIALWGLSLLELYERDFHYISKEQDVSAWAMEIFRHIKERYEATAEKISALEDYRLSHLPRIRELPLPLSHNNQWALYLRLYAQLIQKVRKRQFVEGLDTLLNMLFILIQGVDFPFMYVHFHLMLSYTNLGIVLTNLRKWALYEKWYALWEEGWNRGFWPKGERALMLRRAAIAIRFTNLVRQYKWYQARQLWEKEKEALTHFVLHSHETLSFRANRACAIYFILILFPDLELDRIQWRIRISQWMENQKFREIAFMWWEFLFWYDAYRYRQQHRMRYAYKKLRQCWQKYFREHERWQPVLRLVRALSGALCRTQRRRASLLLQRWTKLPEERQRWEFDAIIFPMIDFVKIIEKGGRDFDLNLLPSVDSASLPQPLEEKVEHFLERFAQHIRGTR